MRNDDMIRVLLSLPGDADISFQDDTGTIYAINGLAYSTSDLSKGLLIQSRVEE